MTAESERAARIVGEVVAAEVARTRSLGVILASPPGPEADLLARWLSPTLPLRHPEPGAVSDVAGALAAADTPGAHVEALAWQAVARAQSLSQRLLPVGTTNKTMLLLEDAPLAARVLPLGDVWATDVGRWAGGAALPALLRNASMEEVAAVEAALRRYLQEGVSPSDAFTPLGPLAAPVLAALDAAEHRRRGLVIAKLEGWTAGIDLAR